ncbi:MAG: hypothetical protein PHV97_06460, partial [Candidatus Omnitrophica bacterium]|nr:hypothetical protein [Candidatus Omnitrophota bacterium]
MPSTLKILRSFVIIPVAALLMSLAITTGAQAASAFNLLDARERGTTVTGVAKGTLTATFDEAIKKDVLEFDYSISQGAAVTAWVKNFPEELTSSTVQSAKIGIKTFEATQADEVAVTIEIRGAQGVQMIPLSLKNGWDSFAEKIDWAKVGALKEVAFVVNAKGSVATVKGTLSFSLEFVPQAVAAQPAQVTVAGKPVTTAVTPATAKIPSSAVTKTTAAGVVKTGATFAPRTVPIPAAVSAVATPSAVTKAAPSVNPVQAPVVAKVAPAVIPAKVTEPPARSSFGLLDAGEKGVTNNGNAKGVVTFSFDEESKKDVYDLGYTLSQGSSITVWTKKFPADLTGAQVNTLEFGLRALEASQLSQLSVKAEVIGASNTQRISLSLKPGWNAIQKSIRWKAIGELREVNFIISPKESAGSIQGTLYLGFDFCKATFFQKYLVAIKFGSVLFLAFLLAFLAAFAGKLFGRDRRASQFRASSDQGPDIISPKEISTLSRIKKDFLYGAITVLILGTAVWIYSLGMREVLSACSMTGILAAGALGALIAECLKHQFTGKHLTAAEVFQNVLVTGILAAASSRLELLQAPTMWSNLLMINKLTATVA